MTYRTCVGCIHGTGFCQAREDIKARVKGIGVTSLKWKCRHRRPIYQPGEAVWVNLFVGMEDHGDDWGREVQCFAEFPGTVIRLKGSKAIVFVEPGSSSKCEDYTFEPQGSGNGHVKITLTRVWRRDAARKYVCELCENVVSLCGHKGYCQNAPIEERRAWEGYL